MSKRNKIIVGAVVAIVVILAVVILVVKNNKSEDNSSEFNVVTENNFYVMKLNEASDNEEEAIYKDEVTIDNYNEVEKLIKILDGAEKEKLDKPDDEQLEFAKEMAAIYYEKNTSESKNRYAITIAVYDENHAWVLFGEDESFYIYTIDSENLLEYLSKLYNDNL